MVRARPDLRTSGLRCAACLPPEVPESGLVRAEQERRTIGEATFGLSSGRVTLNHLEINEFCSGGGGCADHREQLEFEVSCSMCGERMEACFQVWVDADGVTSEFHVTSGIGEWEDDEWSASDLTLVRDVGQ